MLGSIAVIRARVSEELVHIRLCALERSMVLEALVTQPGCGNAGAGQPPCLRAHQLTLCPAGLAPHRICSCAMI